MQISDGTDDSDGSSISFIADSKGNCKVRYTGVLDNTVIGATWESRNTAKTYTFFDGEENWNSGNIQQEFYVIPQSNIT